MYSRKQKLLSIFYFKIFFFVTDFYLGLIVVISSGLKSICKSSAENSSNTKAGVQLLTTANCLTYGADIHYHNTDKELNIDLF